MTQVVSMDEASGITHELVELGKKVAKQKASNRLLIDRLAAWKAHRNEPDVQIKAILLRMAGENARQAIASACSECRRSPRSRSAMAVRAMRRYRSQSTDVLKPLGKPHNPDQRPFAEQRARVGNALEVTNEEIAAAVFDHQLHKLNIRDGKAAGKLDGLAQAHPDFKSWRAINAREPVATGMTWQEAMAKAEQHGATLHYADFHRAMMPGKEVRMMTASNSPPRLDTSGRIAAWLGVPTYRVQYVVSTRGIAPAAYAGGLRLFDREAVARIRHELTAIDARQAGGGA